MEQRDDWHLTEEVHHQQGRGDPFAAAVRATRMPMVITDPSQPDNPIVFVNEAFQQLTGYGRDEIVGRNCRFLQGPGTSREDVAKIRAAIEAGESIDMDLLNYRKDGSTFWNALYLSPVRSDDGRIRFFFASQMNVTDRVNTQARIIEQKAAVEREVQSRTAALQEALEAKTLLLHEVDHRVKNNLTMIGSLLRLQARAIEDPKILNTLTAMLERIDALASVHRNLHESIDVRSFDVSGFAATLASDVIGSSGRSDILLESDLQPITVASQRASSIGLILNEIVTNAVKHAFKDGRSGTLRLRTRTDGAQACIEIEDDGPGMNANAKRAGLGRTLVDRLSKQIGGGATWSTLEKGTLVQVSFPTEVEL